MSLARPASLNSVSLVVANRVDRLLRFAYALA